MTDFIRQGDPEYPPQDVIDAEKILSAWGNKRGGFWQLGFSACRSFAGEAEILKREVREWICTDCNIVYPGPPQDGLKCVVCTECGGNAMPRGVADRLKLKQEIMLLEHKMAGYKKQRDDLLKFIRHAQVSSGVCCCGDAIKGHPTGMQCGHEPVDIWGHAVAAYAEEIATFDEANQP